MILIPGFLISLVTFPGVIVHEAAHQLMCRLTGTPVIEVCYFRVGNPSGYVLHGPVSSPLKHFLISVAPFVLNTLLALVICLPTALAVWSDQHLGPLDILLGWLGMSMGMHAIPSSGDAKSLWSAMKGKTTSIGLKMIGFPVAAIIMIASVLSVVWFDAIFAAGICFGIPKLIIDSMS